MELGERGGELSDVSPWWYDGEGGEERRMEVAGERGGMIYITAVCVRVCARAYRDSRAPWLHPGRFAASC